MNRHRSKRYLYLRFRSLERRKRREVRKKKQRNIRKKKRSNNLVTYKSDKNTDKIIQKTIYAGSTFSLIYDPLNIIRIIRLIDANMNDTSSIIKIEIDLSLVVKIDSGAICLLLAKINEVSTHHRGIRFFGTFPKNEECKRTFIDSGASEYMKDMYGRDFEKHGDNLIIRIGSDKTENEKVGQIIRKSMKYITGREFHFPPVFSIVQEMCANSVEHSSDHVPNWMFGIIFEEDNLKNEKYVTFTMTDVGLGILNTLNRKLGVIIKEKLKSENEVAILHSAFQKKYGSKTEDINRNKGLPLIFSRVKKQYVQDMKVITNNVILDLSNISNSSVLKQSLPGTFYSWKVDLNNIKVWNQKIIC